MAAAPAPAGAPAQPAPQVSFYATYPDALAGVQLPASQVSASRGCLKSDPARLVLTRLRTPQGAEYLFCRLPLSALAGATAYDVYVAGKGRFRVFSCQPPPDQKPGDPKKLLRLNLESYGAFPEEGAPPEKLINVIGQKMWPAYLQGS